MWALKQLLRGSDFWQVVMSWNEEQTQVICFQIRVHSPTPRLPHTYTFLRKSLLEAEIVCSSMGYLIKDSTCLGHTWMGWIAAWGGFSRAAGAAGAVCRRLGSRSPAAGRSTRCDCATAFPFQSLSAQKGNRKGSLECKFACICRWGRPWCT